LHKVIEPGHVTPVKGKDSLQQYCHQNPVKMVDNTLKSELQIAGFCQFQRLTKEGTKKKKTK
jgi:hypothetical protein